jgi:hypothetical protein
MLSREGAPRGREAHQESATHGPAVAGPPRCAYGGLRRGAMRAGALWTAGTRWCVPVPHPLRFRPL